MGKIAGIVIITIAVLIGIILLLFIFQIELRICPTTAGQFVKFSCTIDEFFRGTTIVVN